MIDGSAKERSHREHEEAGCAIHLLFPLSAESQRDRKPQAAEDSLKEEACGRTYIQAGSETRRKQLQILKNGWIRLIDDRQLEIGGRFCSAGEGVQSSSD